MNNTNKAEEIAKECQLVYGWKDKTGFEECYNSALKMAEYKDQEKEELIHFICNWLEENFISKCGYIGSGVFQFYPKPAVAAFLKAIEEYEEC